MGDSIVSPNLFNSRCESCKISKRKVPVDGRTIPLGDYWLVNHYMEPQERFLGWLVIQPKRHVKSWRGLMKCELEEFGVVTKQLETALIKSYNKLSSHDKVKIVYLVRLAESTLEKRNRKTWHLHVHMIPRTTLMKKKCVSGWKIAECRQKGVKEKPTKKKISQLMTSIRKQF